MVQDSYNFSAGPSVLPPEVKLRAIEELATNGSNGFSVMEISHRSDRFHEILNHAEEGLRRLLDVPEGYRILFISGGASQQFSMIPHNFLSEEDSADYLVTGYWGNKAAKEAEKCGKVRLSFDGSSDGFRKLPPSEEMISNANSSYLHYCSNETISGLEFDFVPASRSPLICDASSNILSKRIPIEQHSLVYAGAQKNIGPSGISIAIISDEFMGKALPNRLSCLDYKLFSEHRSMPNTPNTWGIFIIGLVCDWIESQGGIAGIETLNQRKASLIYDVLDEFPDFYIGHVERRGRSRMNITFSLPDEVMEREFLNQAEEAGLMGMKGHRSLGGVRASMYNAFPVRGAEKLAEFMIAFRSKHS